MFSWNSLAFSMIQRMLAIWSLVPLPFLKPAQTSWSSRFTYCWPGAHVFRCSFLCWLKKVWNSVNWMRLSDIFTFYLYMFKIKLLWCQWAEGFFFFSPTVYFNLWRPFTASLKGDRLITDSLIWCLAKCKLSSVAQWCLTLCDPIDCRTPGFPVHHQLLELVQTHVHLVGDAI